MGDLTKNFSRHEFECGCGCGFDHISLELVEVLQDVREHFDAPVRVTSACRCEDHNYKVGGAKRSKHLLGIAADIVVSRVVAPEVFSYLDKKYGDRYGLGEYKKFTHVDVRDAKARWSY